MPIITKVLTQMMGKPPVKGVNVGAGMSAAFLSGEENSDEIKSVSGKA